MVDALSVARIDVGRNRRMQCHGFRPPLMSHICQAPPPEENHHRNPDYGIRLPSNYSAAHTCLCVRRLISFRGWFSFRSLAVEPV